MLENVPVIDIAKMPVTSLAVIDAALALETAVSALSIVAELGHEEYAELTQRRDSAVAAALAEAWSRHLYLLRQAIRRVEAAQHNNKAQLPTIVRKFAETEQSSMP